MVLFGLAGMRFTLEGIYFNPYIPSGIDQIQLMDIPYIKSTIYLKITGSGSKIFCTSINGKVSNNFLPSNSEGKQIISICLSNNCNC